MGIGTQWKRGVPVAVGSTGCDLLPNEILPETQTELTVMIHPHTARSGHHGVKQGKMPQHSIGGAQACSIDERTCTPCKTRVQPGTKRHDRYSVIQ